MEEMRETARRGAAQRYPAVARKLFGWFREHPENLPVSASDLVRETGFITREAVVRQVLEDASWAEEIGDGFFVRHGGAEAFGIWPETGSAADRESETRSMPGDDPASEEKREPPRSLPEEDPAFTERLKELLRRESARNRLGVSLTYLKHLCGNPNDARLRRILKTAPWSAEQYGLYRFREAGEDLPVKPEVQPDREEKAIPPGQPEPHIPDPAACEQLALDLGDLMPPPAAPSDTETPAEPKPEPIIKAEAAPETAPGWEQLALAVPAAGRTEARIGTVLSVSGKWGKAGKAGKSAALRIDLGPELGLRRVKEALLPAPEGPIPLSNALPRSPESYVGKQVVCAVRFSGSEAAPEILLLAVDADPCAVPLSPTDPVRNGERAWEVVS